MPQRRILLVNLSEVFGGQEAFCARLARLLTPEIRISAVIESPVLCSRLKAIAATRLLSESRRGDLSRYWRFVRAIYEEIRAERPDMIILNGQGEAYLAPLLKHTGIPLVIIRHSSLNLESGWFKRAVYRRNARLADLVISVAQHVQVAQRSFLPNDCNIFISNWIPDELIRPPKVASSNGPLHLAYSGRLTEAKGVIELCAAVCDLPGVSLTLYGEGPLLAKLRAQYAGSNISFPGFIADIDQRYGEADLFILPSHSEAMPQSVLEAWSYGLPCLLSDIPAHREISSNGKGALLCKVGSQENLLEAVTALRNDPEMLTRLAQEGQTLVLRRFTQENARTAYLSAFQEIWG